MFWNKKEKPAVYRELDRENETPVIRASICNGEQVAGFKDRRTGQFKEVLFIRTPEDKKLFMEQYGISPEEIRKEY